jgi:predicted  nucleic acid-binding Zn-ribbon protein
MVEQETIPTDSGGVAAKRFRISLKSSFLVLTVVAVILAGLSELYRASERAERRAHAEDTLRNVRGLHETLTGILKRQIVTNPAKASKYEAQIEQADADLKEVERRLNDLRK